jgi:hypothetical protein
MSALRLALAGLPLATACSLFTGLDDLHSTSTITMADAGPSHFVSASFDDSDAPPASLGSLIANGGGVAISRDTYWSAYQSLFASVSAMPDGTGALARFSKEIPTSVQHVIVDARVLPCKYPVAGFASVLELLCTNGDLAGGVWLHFFPHSGGVRVMSDLVAPGNMIEKRIDLADPITMPGGTWSRVHLDVLYGTSGAVTFSVDGQALPTYTGPVGCAGGEPNRLIVGVYVEGQGASCGTSYDDVVVDVE